MGERAVSCENARGAQENLWPKFFLWSAPLRATSSVELLKHPRCHSQVAENAGPKPSVIE